MFLYWPPHVKVGFFFIPTLMKQNGKKNAENKRFRECEWRLMWVLPYINRNDVIFGRRWCCDVPVNNQLRRFDACLNKCSRNIVRMFAWTNSANTFCKQSSKKVRNKHLHKHCFVYVAFRCNEPATFLRWRLGILTTNDDDDLMTIDQVINYSNSQKHEQEKRTKKKVFAMFAASEAFHSV